MTINTETAIGWMTDREGRVSYSMDYRNGPNSYDCSSSIVSALIAAGATNPGWLLNTEYMHDWLIQNGYELIAENTPWDARRGDVFIWGMRGYSTGAGGHTGIFINSDDIIHCNYARNSITVDNYNATAGASGWMYWYAYRLKSGGISSSSGKSLDILVKETLAGAYGNGDQRKSALGDQYEAVMAVINGNAKTVDELAQEVKQPTEAKTSQTELTGQATTTKEEGDLSFNGAILKKEVLDKIVANCKKHDILPSYALTILHYEGLWGTSAVGKADNNWGGMTWTGQGNRPSGVTVTQGSARPSNEGGHYMHYASVDDFLTDWFYLLRSGGSYKVSGAKTFSEAVKGMFKVGGAVYDYAASGFDSYIVGASSRLKAIESENGSLDKFDKQTVTDVGQSDKIEVTIEGIEISINGVTYELTKKPV